MILDDHMIWIILLEVALGPLVIAFGVLVRGTFLGMPVNAMFRLAGMLMGTGILLMSLSNLLSYVESAAWPRIDRNHMFWAETALGILGPLLVLIALVVLARSRNHPQAVAQDEQES
jgi:hypothetical protein